METAPKLLLATERSLQEGSRNVDEKVETDFRKNTILQGIPGEVLGRFRKRSGNVQETFRKHSGNILETFRKRSGNVQETFWKRSGNVQET